MGQRSIYPTATDPWELRPMKGKPRSTLFLQNKSAFVAYIGEDSIPDANIGIELGAGLTVLYDQSQGPVPQGTIWVAGSQATRQQIIVREA
jgi:hypothetical protein